MRLLNVIRSVDRALGGPVEVVIQSSMVLMQEGHYCETVSLDGAGDSCVKEYPVPVTPLGPGRGRYGYSSAFVPWLREHVCGYDVTLVHGIWDYHSFGVWRALHNSDHPYFVYTHGMLDPWFKKTYPIKHLKKWLYWPWATYRILRDARGVLFTAEDERELARQSFWLYRCRELVVNIGASDNTGDATMQRNLFLNRYPELQNKRIILFLGRIHVKKGCDLLIRAFSKIAAQDKEIHLVMAGPDHTGEKGRLLEIAKAKGIEDRITWTGMLSGDLKWGAFAAADVFALPSHQENFGVAVAEALSCGVPVMITDRVNIWREIQADGAGLVGHDDLDGTLNLLQGWQALSDAERARMRENARACYQKRFDIRSASKQLIAALRAHGAESCRAIPSRRLRFSS